MKVKSVAGSSVVPYARNPRKNEAAVAKAASIKEFGWHRPIVSPPTAFPCWDGRDAGVTHE